MRTASLVCVVLMLPGLKGYPDRFCQSTSFPDPLGMRNCLTLDVCGDILQHSDPRAGELNVGELKRSASKFAQCLVTSIAERGQWILDHSKPMPRKDTVFGYDKEISVKYEVSMGLTLCGRQSNNLRDSWSDSNRWHNINLLLELAMCLVGRESAFKDETLWQEFLCSASASVLKKWNPPVSTVLKLILDTALPCSAKNADLS